MASPIATFLTTPIRAIRRSARILKSRFHSKGQSQENPDRPYSVIVPETQQDYSISATMNDTYDTIVGLDLIPETQTSITDEADVSVLTSDNDSEFHFSFQTSPPPTNTNSHLPSFTPEAFPIDTIVTARDDALPLALNNKEIHLFRGPKNPLSAFHHHPLFWKNHTYISAEAAYQHEKMKQHNVPKWVHKELIHCKSSHDAKRIANNWIPQCSKSWQSQRFEVMKQISKEKLKQCKAFKSALRKTGTSVLVHNIETDPVWGCGQDMRGLNMMGHILMDVRKFDYEQEYPALPSSHNMAPASVPLVQPVQSLPTEHDVLPGSQKKSPITQKKNVLIVGNSNVRGISHELYERGIDATAFVYPGQSTSQIKERVSDVVAESSTLNPDIIMIHTGDIEVRNKSITVSSISDSMSDLTHALRQKFQNARIVISGLPFCPNENKFLNGRIAQVNENFAKLCEEDNRIVFLCNQKAKLQFDCIHLTPKSKDYIARTISRFVKKCI